MRGIEGDRRIVITGMGAVTPLGNDLETTWQKAVDGESGISSVELPPSDVVVAGKVRGFDGGITFSDPVEVGGKEMTYARYRKRLANAAEYALTASHQALVQSRLMTPEGYKIEEGIDPDRVGVLIGTGIGGGEIIGEVQDLIRQGDVSSAFDILRMLPERPAAVASILFKLGGPTYAVSAACATGNVAITGAIKELQLGNADAMLVGGTEAAVHEIGASLFSSRATRTLTRETDPNRASRPFDADRDGFVIGEGAGVLVLEELNHALDRGAVPIAEVVGYGDAADRSHETEPSGEGAARALTLALLGLDRVIVGRDVYVNAHATATKIGDPVEARVINKALSRSRTKWVNAPKSQLGHTLGAAGAIESIFTVKAIETGVVPPVLHAEHLIEETEGLDVIQGQARQVDPLVGINDSFGFGGLNSVVVFQRYEGPTPKREI